MTLLFQTTNRAIAFLMSFFMKVEGHQSINSRFVFELKIIGTFDIANNYSVFNTQVKEFKSKKTSQTMMGLKLSDNIGQYKTVGLNKDKIALYIGIPIITVILGYGTGAVISKSPTWGL